MNINTKEYWNNEWGKRGQRIYPFYSFVANLCKDKKVLDFGCGRGDLLSMLKNAEGMDISDTAIKILEARGLNGTVGTKPIDKYDIIVATELLEHIDNDKEMIEKFFKHAKTVIYAVPNNCLGPNEEPEHQRLYTKEYIKKITPNLKKIYEIDRYLIVVAGEIELKPSVLCAALNEGSIRAEVSNCISRMTHDERVELKVYYPNDRPIAHNRNKIVKKFLEGTEDYLLMIDDDNPPLKNPLDLIQLDKDVIACPTPQWNDCDKFPIYWVSMDKVEDGYIEHKEKKGLQEVDAVGTGCILISRRVLEKVKKPFERKYDSNGLQELGLDFSFCEKAKEQGFKIWSHYDYPCSHFKELNLIEVLKFYG